MWLLSERGPKTLHYRVEERLTEETGQDVKTHFRTGCLIIQQCVNLFKFLLSLTQKEFGN